VQLSINALKPLSYHLELGARLAGLRDRGILIVASGNVVHNLRQVLWDRPDAAFDWAVRFDDAVVAQLEEAPGDILKLTEHPDYELAAPTPDHFIPLLYLAGAAAHEGRAQALVRGYSMGSLSMTCYGVSAALDLAEHAQGAASLPPDVPPDQTNI
jgi:4,5-DOPA dioxygenase extradiol